MYVFEVAVLLKLNWSYKATRWVLYAVRSSVRDLLCAVGLPSLLFWGEASEVSPLPIYQVIRFADTTTKYCKRILVCSQYTE